MHGRLKLPVVARIFVCASEAMCIPEQQFPTTTSSGARLTSSASYMLPNWCDPIRENNTGCTTRQDLFYFLWYRKNTVPRNILSSRQLENKSARSEDSFFHSKGYSEAN